MKAELVSGEIIILEKGCNCIVHNEPHWVYADKVHHDLNRKLIDPVGKDAAQKYYGYLGFAKEEAARLQMKASAFGSRGIVRLIPEESDELTEIQRQKIKQHFEDMRPPEPEQVPNQYLDRETQVRIEAKERV